MSLLEWLSVEITIPRHELYLHRFVMALIAIAFILKAIEFVIGVRL